MAVSTFECQSLKADAESTATASRVHKSCNGKHGILLTTQHHLEINKALKSQLQTKKCRAQNPWSIRWEDQESSLGNTGKFTGFRTCHVVAHWLGADWFCDCRCQNRCNRLRVRRRGTPSSCGARGSARRQLCLDERPRVREEHDGSQPAVFISTTEEKLLKHLKHYETILHAAACSCNWLQSCSNPSCRESRGLPDFPKVKI